MTPVIILTCVTVTATWHDDILTHGNFLIFLKKLKNKIKKKKLIKKLIKKFKKSRNWHVALPLTASTLT